MAGIQHSKQPYRGVRAGEAHTAVRETPGDSHTKHGTRGFSRARNQTGDIHAWKCREYSRAVKCINKTNAWSSGERIHRRGGKQVSCRTNNSARHFARTSNQTSVVHASKIKTIHCTYNTRETGEGNAPQQMNGQGRTRTHGLWGKGAHTPPSHPHIS